ncbi:MULTISPECIES: hypothetical protein [Streptomyces]|uniref:Secreted protein n=2 Tax=Streptomyces TaxID=1883 RepID=A0A3R7HGQ9_9ACTN|nr:MULTISPECIES: hypothetical protein [Streptomyces]PQM20838.1 hypothetical protein Sfr7A_24885 [Streptomyces xinghaiensis]RKM95845.1 hypothetical protein SFRA_012440 [Streptomyces xinghaiensis]
MRTTAKLSFLSLAAAAMIAGSATSAAANDGYDGGYKIKDVVALAQNCGNTAQLAPFPPEAEQTSGQNQTICQIGEENIAVNYAPETETETFTTGASDAVLLGLIGLLTPVAVPAV